MTTENAGGARGSRLRAVRRLNSAVMPLELFFDLLFVLALTQTTALMAAEPTAAGALKAMLVLAEMWWTWGAYAWLTSVVDPEEGAVRIAIAASMVGLMICATCVPEVFGDRSAGLIFAAGFGLVRAMHIVLFLLSARDLPGLRESTLAIGLTTAICIGLLVAAALTGGTIQIVLWVAAVVIDLGGGVFADPSGWRLNPHHFAERHGLVLIIALGESIVAVGAGASGQELTAALLLATACGVVIAFVMWWLYFDVVALISSRRLAAAEPGRVQNTMARDSFSYLHLLMVAGIVFVALGFKKAVGDPGQQLEPMPAAALFGGFALYLLAHVLFRLRNVHTLNTQRLVTALICLGLVAAVTHVSALVAMLGLTAVAVVLLIVELRIHGERRLAFRHRIAAEQAAGERAG